LTTDGSNDPILWLFNHSRELMAVMSPDSRIKFINPAWEACAGWSRDEIIGRSCFHFVHPEDRPIFAESGAELFRKGVSEHTVRLKHGNGEYRWYSSYNQLSPIGEIIGIMRDVSAEKQREAEAETAQRNRALLAEAAGIGSWLFEPGPGPGRSIFATDFCALTGFGPDELQTPAEVQAIVHPDDAEAFREIMRRGVKTGEPGRLQHRLMTKSGRYITVEATFRTELREGGRYALMGVSQNITALVEALAQANAASEAKANFLANMSHEIRTPMNGVLGVLHLLNDEPLTPQGRKMLREAVACGQMLSELLNDVLDFSKIDAGQLHLNPEPLSPGHLIEGVVSLVRPLAEEKGLTLTVERAEAQGWIMADPVRLRQTLFNLLGNAVKFTLEGHVTIQARTYGVGDLQRLRVEVQDTGVGVSEEAQKSLFQRFHQADSSTTRRFGGSGLGLAITEKLVALMGGDVGLTSKLGEGSTFWIDIAAPATDPVQLSVAESGFLDGLSILVIEDNATNRLVATKMLESLGASVETAEDGERGVEAAARGGHDLILMDIQMPGIDGVEAARRIRAAGGPGAEAPIIALTANVLAHQRADYLRAGMNGVVGKPISPNALLAEIARLAAGLPEADGETAAA